MIEAGHRVLKKGWERYEDFQYLARFGRVTRVAGPGLVSVRWDSAAESRLPFKRVGEGAPPRFSVERVEDLTCLWWRAT